MDSRKTQLRPGHLCERQFYFNWELQLPSQQTFGQSCLQRATWTFTIPFSPFPCLPLVDKQASSTVVVR